MSSDCRENVTQLIPVFPSTSYLIKFLENSGGQSLIVLGLGLSSNFSRDRKISSNFSRSLLIFHTQILMYKTLLNPLASSCANIFLKICSWYQLILGS